MTRERKDGKPSAGLVLLETGSSLHRDQDNAEVRVFDERSGTATGTRLSRLFLPHALYFMRNQYLQQRASEVWKPVQSIGRFFNLCSHRLCSHIFNSFRRSHSAATARVTTGSLPSGSDSTGTREIPSRRENRSECCCEQSPQSQKNTLACEGLLAQIAFGTSLHGSTGLRTSNRYSCPPRR